MLGYREREDVSQDATLSLQKAGRLSFIRNSEYNAVNLSGSMRN